MWDDLAGEDGYEDAIDKQVETSASILGLDKKVIFPVSAKQALLAKVKSDDELLKKVVWTNWSITYPTIS